MLRILLRSVRGHAYLVGAPTVHPVDTVPAGTGTGTGTTFATYAQIKRYVRRELGGLSSIWRVTVIDQAGTALLNGTRRGRSGTGNRWVWHQPHPLEVPAPTDRGDDTSPDQHGEDAT